MAKKLPIKKGSIFGMLEVIAEAPQKTGYKRYFLCKCECGNIVTVQLGHLTNKHTTSCGCYRKYISGKLATARWEEKRKVK